jgi:hypothetical protein
MFIWWMTAPRMARGGIGRSFGVNVLRNETNIGKASSPEEYQVKFCVVIPAKDEKLGIGKTVRSVLAAGASPADVYVMDDGSSDGTGAIAKSFGVNVLRNEKNVGKAKSILRATHHWELTEHYDTVCLMDADSRGLIDTLPDEAALAMILSHELAHIALGHKINTKLAFTDRFFFGDSVTFQRLDFGRSQLDEQAADTKALELLNNSPYKDKLATGGLFLRQLEARAKVLPNLIRPHLGNPLGNKNTTRLATIANATPQLEKKIDQIATLSLGARIDMNPWSNQIAMMSSKHVTLLNPEERMPLEVTSFSPYLTRLDTKPTGEETTVKEATSR